MQLEVSFVISFEAHVDNITMIAFFHHARIRNIIASHAFVTSMLN